MPIYLVTSNISKFEEIKKIMDSFQIPIKRINIDIPEIKSLSIEEVVRDKAKKAFAIVKKPVMVDDTGIFFSGYKYFPGTISRFIFITLGFRGIFQLISNNQKAYFKSCVAYLDKNLKEPVIFSGTCYGRLIKKTTGKKRKKMPYDNIFIPNGEIKTFSQLGVAGKQKHDHRSKAVRKMGIFLKKY
jgi:XTP/dITP diphosphohydrolase